MFRIPIISDIADQVGKMTTKMTNKSFLEQAMAACALVANADGIIDDCEVQEVLKYAKNHNVFGNYSVEEVEKAFQKQVAEVKVSPRKVLEVVEGLKGKTAEATLLVNVAIAIGASDGDFDADEQAVVKEIIEALDLDINNFDMPE